MQGNSLRQTVTVTNPQGFHMRPMAAFVEVGNRHPVTITVTPLRPGSTPVNGKSILSLMGLAAVPGSELLIEVTGPGAQEIMQELLEVFYRNFDEEDDPGQKKPS